MKEIFSLGIIMMHLLHGHFALHIFYYFLNDMICPETTNTIFLFFLLLFYKDIGYAEMALEILVCSREISANLYL